MENILHFNSVVLWLPKCREVPFLDYEFYTLFFSKNYEMVCVCLETPRNWPMSVQTSILKATDSDLSHVRLLVEIVISTSNMTA